MIDTKKDLILRYQYLVLCLLMGMIRCLIICLILRHMPRYYVTNKIWKKIRMRVFSGHLIFISYLHRVGICLLNMTKFS